jgi:8-oxo-dGTP diphosphatase
VNLPVFDARGGSLVSLSRGGGASLDALDGSVPLARSLVVVGWSGRVLVGFNVRRQQWELPGGALEPGESAHDAAIRELFEETGIRVDAVRLAARAEFVFGGEATRHLAAVFNIGLPNRPEPVENDEMEEFRWWHAGTGLWPGLSPIDAEVARRCLPDDTTPATRGW